MKELEEALERLVKLLRLHEARLDDIQREERTTEGYIVGEEQNRNKTADQILNLQGENWRIAIIGKSIMKRGEYEPEIIWQAGK